MDDADTKIQSLPADVSEEERDFHKNTFKRAEGNVAEAREKLERAIAIQKAREAVPPMGDDEPGDAEQRKGFGPMQTGRGQAPPGSPPAPATPPGEKR